MVPRRRVSPEIDLDPWSAPDGRSIAFTTVPGRLRLLSLADGAIRDLADLGPGPLSLGLGPTGAGEPWSPDGRYLAVAVVGGHGLCQD
jgi:dipeptidyl aminopeptidase/acylaminoacyl peptidase